MVKLAPVNRALGSSVIPADSAANLRHQHQQQPQSRIIIVPYKTPWCVQEDDCKNPASKGSTPLSNVIKVA